VSDFKITTKDSSINLSKEELFKTILKTVFEDKDNKNLQFSDEYAETILAALGATTNKEFYNISLKQLSAIAFMAGYYYKVFLTKNDVSITTKPGTTEEGSSQLLS
jgi:hypothetical protein